MYILGHSRYGPIPLAIQIALFLNYATMRRINQDIVFVCQSDILISNYATERKLNQGLAFLRPIR